MCFCELQLLDDHPTEQVVPSLQSLRGNSLDGRLVDLGYEPNVG